MNHTFKDAKLFVGGVEVAEIESGSYEIEGEVEHLDPTVSRSIGPETWTAEVTVPVDEAGRQFFEWLGYHPIPTITPDGTVGSACLGVWAWRLLFELQTPLHRRAAMAPYWIRAMQARYVVCGDSLRGCFVRGNQRAVIDVYDRIRKEAGDFDAEELGGLN